jgi:hypothetical protein
MLVSQGSLLSSETFGLGKEDESAFLFAVLRYFICVAEILATDNVEFNVFDSKEQARPSAQVSAPFLFEHAALLYISLSDPLSVVYILIVHSSEILNIKNLGGAF